jgi:endonuclease/exonuclease/phosphatase family metal-dependent hydrolase
MNVHLIPWLLMLAAFASTTPVWGEESPPLQVMTFNLRYASATSPNSWPQRRPVMRALLQEYAPDVIGTQEGLYQQLKDLATDLPAYEWTGLGREGGSRGEFMAVFYRTDRLEPLGFDHFWLSQTPEVIGSKSWGNVLPRMATWVKFRDRQTKQEFYFFNTHLDHLSQASREKSAALILQRVEALKTTLPVVLAGDFNAAAGQNKVYELLIGPQAFTDTWTAAERRGEAIGTFHNFGGQAPGGRRIDWILTRGPVTTAFTEVVTFARNGQYPSDHFPVVARLRLRAGP